jgi:hypothetical protein
VGEQEPGSLRNLCQSQQMEEVASPLCLSLQELRDSVRRLCYGRPAVPVRCQIVSAVRLAVHC